MFQIYILVLVIVIKRIFLLLLVLVTLCGCCDNKIEESSLLVGKVILIDPGHGGRDNGASYNNILEDELNLEIALMLQEELLTLGVYTIITRNDDYDLSDMYAKNKKLNDLKRRVALINDSQVDLFISLHMNVYQNDSVNGAQVFYQNNDDSKYFAKILQDNINGIQDKKRKEMYGDFYLLNNSKRVGVLIEMGFITSLKDMQKMRDFKFKKQLTNTIINSIKNYFGG